MLDRTSYDKTTYPEDVTEEIHKDDSDHEKIREENPERVIEYY